MFRGKEGFTLVELLIAILIIGVLVSIALPLYLNSKRNAQRRTCQANLRTVDGAINGYRATYGLAPRNGANGLLDLKNSGYLKKVPKCPVNAALPYVLRSYTNVPLGTSCRNNSSHVI